MAHALLTTRQLHAPTTMLEALLLTLVLVSAFVIVLHRFGDASLALLLAGVGFSSYILDGAVFIATAVLLAVLLSYPRGVAGIPARDGPAFLRELGVLGAGFVLYELGRMLSQGSARQAAANAGSIMDLQRRLGWPDEAALQQLVLPHRRLVEAFNLTYSYLFLSLVVGVLVWLYLNDDHSYRIFRAALGVSALLTVAISYLFPTAPPRLMETSGLVDTHVLMGRTHGFVNEFAAMPSLHVGWTALAGCMLAYSLGGRRGWLFGLVPGIAISLTVIITGNHYWLDGIVGVAICLAPVLARGAHGRLRDSGPILHLPSQVRAGGAAVLRPLHARLEAIPVVCASVAILGLVVAYLLIGQLVAPGFTDHWGYLTAQVIFTLVAVVVCEWRFRPAVGVTLLSRTTYLAIILATVADVFGTSDDLYANFSAYDKLVHFLGTAALTAVVLDLLSVLQGAGRISLSPARLRLLAVALALSLAGLGWESYEYIGDHVFNSARTGGFWDTTHDLFFDTLGALTVAVLIPYRARIAASFFPAAAGRARQAPELPDAGLPDED